MTRITKTTNLWWEEVKLNIRVLHSSSTPDESASLYIRRSHQISLQKCEKGFKIKISLRKWGRVSDQRSKNRPTNKQELAPRICEKRTHALRTSLLQIFGFTKKKITSRCAVAAAPVLFKNHSTPTWGKHLRVALPLSSVYLSIIYQLNILFNF